MIGFHRCVRYLLFVSLMGFAAGRILAHIPLKINAFPFRLYSFEKSGVLYRRLRVHRWQKLLPDISRVVPWIVPRKSILKKPDRCDVLLLLRENCAAEAVHRLAAVLGCGCLILWPGGGWILSLAFWMGNLPYIVVQRYNRPRIVRLCRLYDVKISASVH